MRARYTDHTVSLLEANSSGQLGDGTSPPAPRRSRSSVSPTRSGSRPEAGRPAPSSRTTRWPAGATTRAGGGKCARSAGPAGAPRRAGLTNVAEVRGGGQHQCVQRDDQSVWSWSATTATSRRRHRPTASVAGAVVSVAHADSAVQPCSPRDRHEGDSLDNATVAREHGARPLSQSGLTENQSRFTLFVLPSDDLSDEQTVSTPLQGHRRSHGRVRCPASRQHEGGVRPAFARSRRSPAHVAGPRSVAKSGGRTDHARRIDKEVNPLAVAVPYDHVARPSTPVRGLEPDRVEHGFLGLVRAEGPAARSLPVCDRCERHRRRRRRVELRGCCESGRPSPYQRAPRRGSRASNERGADTLVWLADSAALSGQSGWYFVDRRLGKPSAAALDHVAAGRLWELSERQVAASAAAGDPPP